MIKPTDYKIKCPFYISENFNSINCEGYLKGTSLRQIFPSKNMKEDWQRKFCRKIIACTGCPVYKNANEKYDV
jgi:hypothetical protein